ncbi:MAG: hypothetical protein AAGB51_00345 [Planctomycetota bacterium]
MADEQQQPAEEAKKSSPMKFVIITAVLMIVEAIAVFGLVTVMGSGPSGADAATLDGSEQDDRERLVEIELIENKFPNNTTGRIWLWDTQIYLQVRVKNEEFVNGEIERRRAEITTGLRELFSRAQDRHLSEPGGETMTRQLTAFVNDVFGDDPDGESRIERVLLTKLAGFPADF